MVAAPGVYDDAVDRDVDLEPVCRTTSSHIASCDEDLVKVSLEHHTQTYRTDRFVILKAAPVGYDLGQGEMTQDL
jgi:hypothetical protein